MFSAPPITVIIRPLNKGAFFQDKTGKMKFAGRVAKELSQLGAFIRQTAIRSIRRVGKKGKPSAPGRPPKQRSDNDFVSLRNIQFYYVPFKQSVVVGPVALNVHRWFHAAGGTPTTGTGEFGPGAVPRVLEHGGFIGVHEEQLSNGTWVPIGRNRYAKVAERLVPVWKATPAEKSQSLGVHTTMKNGKAVNFYRIPVGAKQRVRFVAIAPRPFMEPAARKELEKIRRRQEAVQVAA